MKVIAAIAATLLAAVCLGCSSSNKVVLPPEVIRANASALAMLEQLRGAQEDYRSANGSYAQYLLDLYYAGYAPEYSTVEVSALWQGDESTLRLIGIDETHYVAVATSHAAGTATNIDYEQDPHAMLTLPDAPYSAFLIDESGDVVDKPERVTEALIEAANRKARAALQRVVTAQTAYHADNLAYAPSLSELGTSGPPYLEDYVADGDLGDGVKVAMVGLGETYSAWAVAGPGNGSYHLYRADQTGVVEETDTIQHPLP